MRQQFLDPIDGLLGQSFHDIGEPFDGIDAAEFTTGKEAVEDSGALCSLMRPGKEIIASAHGNGPDQVLDGTSILEQERVYEPARPFIAGLSYEHDLIKRPAGPPADENIFICSPVESLLLNTTGEDIRWYRDPEVETVIAVGPELTVEQPTSSTFFVSQTKNGCESARTRITIFDLDDLSLTFESDTLFTNYHRAFSYAWDQNGVPIADADEHFLKIDSAELYRVTIAVEDCEYQLEYEVLPPTATTVLHALLLTLYLTGKAAK
jgi:hypothetical protein